MPSILVIDDDELSREVLAMLLGSEGYDVATAESGDAAIASPGDAPEIVLADMQMPGVCGDPLAQALRAVYGPSTRLIAMSGSKVSRLLRAHYDGFLLKPFTVQEMEAMLADSVSVLAEGADTPTLDETTYANLHTAMSAKQVGEMFAFCLADAEKRLIRMGEAVSSGDDGLYRREAHTIKGGCGMLGALELRSIAGEMETNGLAGDGNEMSNIRQRFVDATARLRRILEADPR